MRLFVALSIDEKIKDVLKCAAEELRAARAPVRWVKPDGIHLTLKFLGETPDDRTAPLISALEGITPGVYPFPITFSGMGAFAEPVKSKDYMGRGSGTIRLSREGLEVT